MRDVVDPELGINVVDLGLLYGVTVSDDRTITLDLTLTSAACPLTDVIEDQPARRCPDWRRLPDQLGVDAAWGRTRSPTRAASSCAPSLQRVTRR